MALRFGCSLSHPFRDLAHRHTMVTSTFSGQAQSNQEHFLGSIFTIYAGGRDLAPLSGGWGREKLKRRLEITSKASLVNLNLPFLVYILPISHRGDHADPDPPQLVPFGRRV